MLTSHPACEYVVFIVLFLLPLSYLHKIERFGAVILQAHGGNLNGFMILKGDESKLAEVRRDDTSIQNVIEGTYCLQAMESSLVT